MGGDHLKHRDDQRPKPEIEAGRSVDLLTKDSTVLYELQMQ